MKKAAFIVPVYYKGTSFERISNSIMDCIQTRLLTIDSIIISSEMNTLAADEFDNKNFYLHQLKAIDFAISNINQYDRFLFIDFFNPGLDLLRYHLDKCSHDVKIASLLHGGSFIDGDLLNSNWIKSFEIAWSGLHDRIYVPSKYAYSHLPPFIANKAVVSPWGLDAVKKSIVTNDVKSYDVVYPHRMSSDKGIEKLFEIAMLVPEVNFVITSPSGMTPPEILDKIEKTDNINIITCKKNSEYYDVISKAKIVLSCASQELYGYSVAESVLSGCMPILPKSQSYSEFYPSDCLYISAQHAANMIMTCLNQKMSKTKHNLLCEKINTHTFDYLLDDFLAL